MKERLETVNVRLFRNHQRTSGVGCGLQFERFMVVRRKEINAPAKLIRSKRVQVF